MSLQRESRNHPLFGSHHHSRLLRNRYLPFAFYNIEILVSVLQVGDVLFTLFLCYLSSYK